MYRSGGSHALLRRAAYRPCEANGATARSFVKFLFHSIALFIHKVYKKIGVFLLKADFLLFSHNANALCLAKTVRVARRAPLARAVARGNCHSIAPAIALVHSLSIAPLVL